MPKAPSTMKTIGARHSVPKNQRTPASCWLFSANAKRVKKMKARKSQTKIRITSPGPILVAHAEITRDRQRESGARLGLLDFVGFVAHRHLRIDRLAQGLARFEMRNELLGDHHLLARAGIAPHPRRAAVDREAAKTANLDAVP